MNLVEELSHMLRPAGGWIHLVSTGRAEQLALQRRLYVRAERVTILDRLWRKETTPQHLGDVFLRDRLDRLFPLPLKDAVQVTLKCSTEGVTLRGIACE